MDLPDLFALPAELMDVDDVSVIERPELIESADGEPLGVELRRAVLRVRVCDANAL